MTQTFVKDTKFYVDPEDLDAREVWYRDGESSDYASPDATPVLYAKGVAMYPGDGANISRPAKERVARATRIIKAYMDNIPMYCEVKRGSVARVIWEAGENKKEGNSDFRATEFKHIVLGGNAKNIARDARMLEKETARAVSKGVAFTGYFSQSARFSVHPRLRVMRARKVATNLFCKKVPMLVSLAPTYAGSLARNPRWKLVEGVS